jgi:hypothetical protein
VDTEFLRALPQRSTAPVVPEYKRLNALLFDGDFLHQPIRNRGPHTHTRILGQTLRTQGPDHKLVCPARPVPNIHIVAVVASLSLHTHACIVRQYDLVVLPPSATGPAANKLTRLDNSSLLAVPKYGVDESLLILNSSRILTPHFFDSRAEQQSPVGRVNVGLRKKLRASLGKLGQDLFCDLDAALKIRPTRQGVAVRSCTYPGHSHPGLVRSTRLG